MPEQKAQAREEQTGRYQLGYHVMGWVGVPPIGYEPDPELAGRRVRSTAPTHIHDHETKVTRTLDPNEIYLSGVVRLVGPRFSKLPEDITL